MMSARSQQTELERIIEALIFSFFIYIFYLSIWGANLPLEWRPQSTTGSAAYVVSVSKQKLVSLVVIAVILGFSYGYVKGNDLLLRLLRYLKLSQRSSRESVWVDVFLNHGGFVQVGLADGRNVVGWLKQYAEIGEERTLFLERAYWVSEGSDPVDVPGDGLLLLTEKAEIQSVMFLNKGK